MKRVKTPVPAAGGILTEAVAGAVLLLIIFVFLAPLLLLVLLAVVLRTTDAVCGLFEQRRPGDAIHRSIRRLKREEEKRAVRDKAIADAAKRGLS